MATVIHFRPLDERPAPPEMRTPDLVREFAYGRYQGESSAPRHARHCAVVDELVKRGILD